MTECPPDLITRRLRLRIPVLEDAPDIARLAGDPEISGNTLEIPYPYDQKAANEWIDEVSAALRAGTEILFAITGRNTGELYGVIGLMDITREHSRAKLGYWIGRPYWNQGYATEAVCAVLDYGFRVLSLNRIYAFYLTRNPASGRVLDKCSMRHEGVLRQHVRRGDGFEDIAVHGILKGEYLSSL